MTCDPIRRKTAPRPSFRASAKQKESKMARKRPKINTSVYPLFCGRCFTVRALLKSNKMIHVDLKDAVLHMLRNLSLCCMLTISHSRQTLHDPVARNLAANL